MMSSYVCRQCRAGHILRLASPRNPQWQPRATFISLNNNAASADTPEASSQDQHSGTSDRLDSTPSTKGPPGRYKRYVETPSTSEYSSRPQPNITRHEVRSVDSRAPDKSIYKIWDALDERNLDRAWEIFLKTYTSKDCDALSSPVLARSAGGVFKGLIDHTVLEFCRAPTSTILSPTTVLFRYHQLDLFRFERENEGHDHRGQRLRRTWAIAIGSLTDNLLSSASAGGGQHFEPVMAELLSVWRLFFRCNGVGNSSSDSLDTQWQALPDINQVKLYLNDSKRQADIRTRISVHHPKERAAVEYAYSAVILFTFLKEKSRYGISVPESLREEAAPFVRFLAHLLPGADLWRIFAYRFPSALLRTFPEKIRDLLAEEISSAPMDASILIGEKAFGESPVSESQRASNQEEYLLKRIARAVQEQVHKKRVDQLWEETVRAYTTADNKTTIPIAIYNAFLTGYLRLYAPDHSVQVWNHMIANGVKPDVKAWTAMLTGAEKARDLDGLTGIWQRMVRSGIQPDVYAWTSRIHGLLSLRQINPGLAAMDEMGQQWVAAEQAVGNTPKKSVKKGSTKSTVNNLPKPSVEVINGATSAITGIPRYALSFDSKLDYVRKILQWAGNFSIKPDARTYNILIKLYMDGEDYATVSNLLQKMQSEGIEADLATYTMLIRASFENHAFHNLSETEQTSRILALFSQLEAGGLKLNAYVYSSSIDSLLKHHNNFSAVRAVVDHMMSRNMIPSPHIFTSLITHHFQESPPNIEAVDALWNQIMRTAGTPTDRQLFDRLIEGYGSVGEVGKMMAVLAVMSKHGKLPSWPALTAVVRALVEAGDWERARGVVRDVENGEGVAQGGVSGMFGQKDFYYMVKNLRIMELDAEYEQGTPTDGNELGTSAEPDWIEETVVESGYQEVHDVHAIDKAMGDTSEKKIVGTEPPPVEEWRTDDNGSVGGIPL